jgi:hypothetical protein
MDRPIRAYYRGSYIHSLSYHPLTILPRPANIIYLLIHLLLCLFWHYIGRSRGAQKEGRRRPKVVRRGFRRRAKRKVEEVSGKSSLAHYFPPALFFMHLPLLLFSKILCALKPPKRTAYPSPNRPSRDS